MNKFLGRKKEKLQEKSKTSKKNMIKKQNIINIATL